MLNKGLNLAATGSKMLLRIIYTILFFMYLVLYIVYECVLYVNKYIL